MSGFVQKFAAACLLFATACCLGLVLLALMFKLGALSGIDILFYRGIALAMLTAAAVFTILVVAGHWLPGLRVGVRDAVAATALSLGLNLAFLVIFPVTIDRSITVYMLGRMAAQSDRIFTVDDLRADFVQTYLGDYRQIERRVQEQLASGSIEPAGNGYRISATGRAFIATSRRIAWLFDIDERFVAPRPARR